MLKTFAAFAVLAVNAVDLGDSDIFPHEPVDQTTDGDNPDGWVGRYGVDISEALSSSSASCLKSYGYDWIAPRAYHSYGAVDTAACTSLRSAKGAGFSMRDVYMFPCPTCNMSAATQVNDMVTYLKNNCSADWSGRIWLDIEGTQYWFGNYTSNRSWYQALVTACESHTGVTCGVYASYY